MAKSILKAFKYLVCNSEDAPLVSSPVHKKTVL
jgi:hypothetical protein